jgi:MOSC domain-containing protein YiiM
MSLYVGAEDLEAGLPGILAAPASEGTVELVVRRPAEGEREVLDEGVLDPAEGLVGDDWLDRNARRGRAADPATQLTLMSARVIDLVAGSRDRWPLAGDQLYVDLDLSTENLPPGTRLAVGTALLEVTDELHTGCAKFTERFGPAAIRFVNGRAGRPHRLRGMYARVVEAGSVRPGDAISKL